MPEMPKAKRAKRGEDRNAYIRGLRNQIHELEQKLEKAVLANTDQARFEELIDELDMKMKELPRGALNALCDLPMSKVAESGFGRQLVEVLEWHLGVIATARTASMTAIRHMREIHADGDGS